MTFAARCVALLAGLGAAAGVSAEPFRLVCTSMLNESHTREVVVDPETRTVLIDGVGTDEATITATRIKFHWFSDLGEGRLMSYEVDRNTGVMEETVRDLSDTVVWSNNHKCEPAGPRFASAEPFRLVCTNTLDESNTGEVLVDPETQTVLIETGSADEVTITATRIEFHQLSDQKRSSWEIDRNTGRMEFSAHDLSGTLVDIGWYKCELAGS